MKKLCYEAPDMEVVRVELEKGFMAASVFETKDNSEDLKIKDHQVDETFDFSDSGWD